MLLTLKQVQSTFKQGDIWKTKFGQRIVEIKGIETNRTDPNVDPYVSYENEEGKIRSMLADAFYVEYEKL